MLLAQPARQQLGAGLSPAEIVALQTPKVKHRQTEFASIAAALAEPAAFAAALSSTAAFAVVVTAHLLRYVSGKR